MPDLRAMLGRGRVLVADGAMGTMLYERGVFVNVCYDELNATHPDLVEDVHGRYLRAGAEILETNTFGANPVKLSSYRLEDRTEELNRRGASIAVRAAGRRAAVAGAVGPLGIRVEPLGPTSLEEARECFGRQVDGLLEGGVDGFVLETFSDLAELEQAFRAVRLRCDLPVIAQVTVEGDDGRTATGASAEQAARAAADWGADVVGLNCSVGPAAVLEALERMAGVTSVPLSAQPNAGQPVAVRERKMYLTGPDYMARYARRLVDAGARIVGGCCGTTPEHIRRISEQVRASRPSTVSVRAAREAAARTGGRPAPPLATRSGLGRRLAEGGPVTSVRILPPKGWDTAALLDDCRALAAAGADLVAVHEDRGAARLGVLAAAATIARRCPGVEPLVHYTCRDRKLSRMMSDLLGAAASGLRNVLLLTGDPPAPAPYPAYRSVVDVDSIGLANVVAGLNAGLDPSGNDLGEPAGFVVGVALDQWARDRTRELGRFRWKVDAGADFAVTRPVFDAGRLRGFLAEAEDEIPVIAGILPLESARQAEFLQNEVPGVHVPDRVVERMRRARGRAAAEGAAIAREIAGELRDEVAGFQISAVGEGVEAALGVVEGLGG
ncbi:MAG: bifunctional homocysteine S-methyltransferase/methylenetetrahydrofolate reductase [Gemmatimonadota bacterium]|nr:bifunctional homocysteine S-methyltransferase/methylenetetrahydrofolate reductase [Gemmatimonadota bacterium]